MAKPRVPVNFGVQQSQSPRDEGFPLSLLKLPEGMGSAKEVVTFGLDISAAPVPQRRYAAEVCEVSFLDGDLRLVFAQRAIGVEGLESALVIRLNPMAAVQFLGSIEDMADPGLDQIAKVMGIQPQFLSAIKQRPGQTVNMIANLVAVAISGFETCMDFYHASAFAMRQIGSGNTLSVEAVVRVDIQTAKFLSIVSELRSIAKSHPEFPKEVNRG